MFTAFEKSMIYNLTLFILKKKRRGFTTNKFITLLPLNQNFIVLQSHFK